MKPPEKNKKSEQLTTPDSFCWNEKCSNYGRVNAGNLRKFGFTRKGRQRWQCATCKKVVTETKGTVCTLMSGHPDVGTRNMKGRPAGSNLE